MLKITTLFIFLFFSFIALSQPIKPPILQSDSKWCDSILSTMSIEEKIGQLIMVTTYPSLGSKNEKQISDWIKNQHIGGILFLKTTPSVLAQRSQNYQQQSKTPLFIAIDAENGLSFRMDSVVKYPHLMGLGAIENNELIYRMGREVGQQCKALGINVNFAPVADVNSNKDNPVINYRSFGENPKNVATKTWQYAKGIQDEKILVSVKHFPGHGDTSFDSHIEMPIIERPYSTLDSVDFLPFKCCIDNGINGIMTAHINLSQLDSTKRPSTLSKRVMTEILRDSLGFEGLVFSDGMNMQGITHFFDEGTAAVEALKAGVDVIEFVLKPEVVIAAVKLAIEKNEITDSIITQKCRKVLLAKTWTGISNKGKSAFKPDVEKITDPNYQLTARNLYSKSITVIQNIDSILPLQHLDTLKIASLSIGSKEVTTFQHRLEKYMTVDHFTISINATPTDIQKIINKLKPYNLVIAGIHGTRMSSAKNFSVSATHSTVVETILNQNNTILAFFANPYSLNCYKNLQKAKSILITYGENDLSEDFAAQLIFGAIGSNSKLPVSINNDFVEGNGFILKETGRLKYGIPEEVGIDSKLLKTKIDSLSNEGIGQRYFPGCQILIAKNGTVIFNEGYGYYTYQKQTKVTTESLYDLASVTKILGPLPLLMKMVEDSILNLDKPFSSYWSSFKHTDKENITLREMLAHQAGFKPSVNFVYEVMKKINQNTYFRSRPSEDFSVRIWENLYIRTDFQSLLYEAIQREELKPDRKYVYSDLPSIIYPQVISSIYKRDYEDVLNCNFFSPLGISNMMYNPYNHVPQPSVAPTEIDYAFRKDTVQGFVHDESAAMLGGISGNAGLFSNSNELAKVMQFYLNEGYYGDFRYLQSSTIEKFRTVQYLTNNNRRGLGFDKPYTNNASMSAENSYPAPSSSSRSFGHTGFTGTLTWADPDNKLIFIFLSNRTFPNRENKKLINSNFRPKMQQEVYNCQKSFTISSY